MNNTTYTLQTAEVQELTDEQLEQVNGGFFWFLFAPIITFAARMTAGYFAQKGTQESVTAITGSEQLGELAGNVVGLKT